MSDAFKKIILVDNNNAQTNASILRKNTNTISQLTTYCLHGKNNTIKCEGKTKKHFELKNNN